VPSGRLRYGAGLAPAGPAGPSRAIESAADLLTRTVETLARRTPSVGAEAARDRDAASLERDGRR